MSINYNYFIALTIKIERKIAIAQHYKMVVQTNIRVGSRQPSIYNWHTDRETGRWTLPVVARLTEGPDCGLPSSLGLDGGLMSSPGPRLDPGWRRRRAVLSSSALSTGSLCLGLARRGRLQTLILCTYVAILPTSTHIKMSVSFFPTEPPLNASHYVWLCECDRSVSSLLHNNDAKMINIDNKQFQPIHTGVGWPKKEGHPTCQWRKH